MLATIEDGFSEVKNIQISKNRYQNEDAEAKIGTSNLFALFSVGIKGNLNSGSSDGQTIIEEKTHIYLIIITILCIKSYYFNYLKREILS